LAQKGERMSAKRTPKGPWINRIAIHLLTVALTILIFWFLGFLVEDIKTIEGPRYEDTEKEYVDQALVAQLEELQARFDEVKRTIENRQEEQRIVGDSSESLQRTINQLIELQKLSMEKDIGLSQAEQKSLADSIGLFLESQTKYEELNASISMSMGSKRALKNEMRGIEERLEEQRDQAREAHDELYDKHRLKLAFFQLVILVPLLAIAAYLVLRKRQNIFFPLFLAFGIATILKVTIVVHEYFPTRFFKYILIAVLILAVARLLVYFIKVVAFPKAQWLTKQYRDAYRHHLCPVCEYPIQIGPLKFLHWTRRTVHKLRARQTLTGDEEVYACPSCGATLFEECTECQKIRHSLLPHCRHCGAEKEIGA
jgi:hypothetical protein